MAEEKIVLELRNAPLIALLVILSVFFFMELQVAFNTPISFGDEGLHTRMSQYMAEEKEYPVWVPIVGSDKADKTSYSRPPLWHLLEGGFFLVFGFNEFIARFLVPFIAFITGIAAFILTKRLYGETIAFISTILLVTMPSFVLYSVLFYVDALVTLFFVFAVLLFVLSMRTGSLRYLVLSAVFTVFALLTKTTSIGLFFFFPLVFVYEMITKLDKKQILAKYGIFAVVILVFYTPFILRSIAHYGTVCNIPYIELVSDTSGCTYPNKIEQTTKYSARTAEVGSEASIFGMGLLNYFDFAYGNIWLVLFGLIGGIVISIVKKDETTIVLLLMLVSIVPIFYNSIPRAEDAARYMLGWSPFIAILAAIYFSKIYNFLKNYQRHLSVVIIIFVIVLGYQNFHSKLTTMQQVKQFSPLFFEACDWIKDNLQKDVLISTVWVYRAVYNCQRTTMGNPPDIFLSKDVEKVKLTAQAYGITHLFIQKFSLTDQAFAEGYKIDSVQFFADNPEVFKKVYENGPSLQECISAGGCDGNILYELVF